MYHRSFGFLLRIFFFSTGLFALAGQNLASAAPSSQPSSRPSVQTPPPARPFVQTPPPARPSIQTPPLARPSVQTPPPARPSVQTPPPARPSVQPPTAQVPTSNPASSWAQAILINGGGEARSNYYSHVLYLRMMYQTLQEVGFSKASIQIFASDGDDPAPDQAIVTEKERPEQRLFSGRREAHFYRLPTKLISTEILDAKLRPATQATLKPAFSSLATQIQSDPRPLFVFVTDHGTQNRKEPGDRNNLISLWKEDLSVREYHRFLRPFGKRRIVSVMSQCFSGSFAWSVFRRPGRISIPLGDRCGFFATLPDRLSYGCFPETRLKEGVGHAYHFIQAMRQAETMDEAHRHVLLTDQTPDIPLRSSDAFLYLLLREDAEALEVKPEAYLAAVFKRHAQASYPGMQDDLALIGSIASRFGLPRPLHTDGLFEQKAQIKKTLQWWERVERMWTEAFTTARDHHLQRLYQKNTKLSQEVTRLLAAHTQASKRPQGGRALADALRRFREGLPRLPSSDDKASPPTSRGLRTTDISWSESRTQRELKDAFLLYVQSRPELQHRFDLLHQKQTEMRRHVFRLRVQIAALERIEVLFYRIAGRLQLHHSKHPDHQAYRQGFQNLVECEATRIAPPSSLISKLPTLGPLALAEREPPLPSWFGIAFQPVSPQRHPALPSGAIQVQTVYPQTPAANAGITEGDIIVSFGKDELREPFEIRERVMLAPTSSDTPLQILRQGELISLPLRFQRLVSPPSMAPPPILGQTAPALSSLSSLDPTKPPPAALSKGSSLLFFWATWCGPCKAALPALRLFQQRYPSLQIVTVSNEDPSTLHAWLAKNPKAMPFLNLADSERLLFTRLRIRATPTFLLLKDGKVSFVHVGFSKMDDLERQIQTLFEPPPR